MPSFPRHAPSALPLFHRSQGLVIDDFRRRLPLYPSDLRDGLNGKALASCLFMFFATFSSTGK